MAYRDLEWMAEYMRGADAQIFDTKVEGIYDAQTARHGGFLVDIDLHPELKKYGQKVGNSLFRAFEEDYEALKVLWLYPELVNNLESIDEWLTAEAVVLFDKDKSFLKDFPQRRKLDIENQIVKKCILLERADEEYPYNVQIWTSVDYGKNFCYAGNGKFFKNLIEVGNYIDNLEKEGIKFEKDGYLSNFDNDTENEESEEEEI